MKEAQASLSSHDIVSNQVKYNLKTRQIEQDLIPYCKSQKITVVAYSPLKVQAVRKGNDLLDEIASKYGKTRAQIALNFLTTDENVVAIPKSDNLEHVKENCSASGWSLSKEDMKRISERFK